MRLKAPNLPMNHPDFVKFYLLTEYGLTDKDLDDISAQSLKKDLIILKGLSNRQKLEDKESELKR